MVNLSTAFYMLSMSIFPLWWSSFSETSGRRAVYIISFSTSIIWNVLAAESSSIGMLIAMRILSGGSAAAVQAVGAGTVADIWEPCRRGRAMGLFYLGPLMGPLLAPIIGGGLTDAFGWRSTQWFQAAYGVLIFLLILCFLPETHAPTSHLQSDTSSAQTIFPRSRHISQDASACQTRKDPHLLYRLFIEPLTILAYLRRPAVSLTVYYASVVFGSLWYLNISVQKTFSHAPYNFSASLVGCLYIFNAVGYILASLLGGSWVDRIMVRKARKAGRYDEKGKLVCRPEDRVGENIWIAAFSMPVALLWYGWCADFKVHWAACMVSGFFFGVGSLLVFNTATTMLTEFVPGKPSNGVALNNFVRNMFSFVGAFTAEPLINSIGNGWTFTAIALLVLGSVGSVVAIKRWGEAWRARDPY
ncbi:MAG: hypothetical protein Q9159_004046 [Coniocarpon cinnabarinum]